MAFWKPGTLAPGSSLDRETTQELSTTLDLTLANNTRISTKQLPIYKSKTEICYLLEKFGVVVIVGQTGSGKTTQIPQFLHEAGWTADGRIVACTQPRRVAAISVATRVSEEMGVPLGTTVGYSVRFDDKTSPIPGTTRIKYMTDGTLFREMLLDPLLSSYSVIMIDEAHERSLYTDLLCGVLKKVRTKRPDLKLIISSATLDAEYFQAFFNTGASEPVATIMSLEGRMYPVDIHYLTTPCEDYIRKAVQVTMDINEQEPMGDILVFLTGVEEINHFMQLLSSSTVTTQSTSKNTRLRAPILDVLPLYGGLPLSEQLKVFDPPMTPLSTQSPIRRVIVSTNIAETSLTIPGIVYVIDPGFVKIKAFNPQTTLDSLIIIPISKSSALQRAGRAGRTKPGKVYRLYTESNYQSLDIMSIPELQRTNLSGVLLQLKSLGIENILRFEYLSPPPSELIIRGLEVLYSLNCLDIHGRLTIPFGTSVAEFPLEPMLSTVLLNSPKFGCVNEILTILSILSLQSIFITSAANTTRAEIESTRRKFYVEQGDHITYLNIFNAYKSSKNRQKFCAKYYLDYSALVRAERVRGQLELYLRKYSVYKRSDGSQKYLEEEEDRTIAIRKCLITGFFSHAATLSPDGSYKLLRGGEAILQIHPNSVIFKRSPQWIVFHEVVETTKPFMRDVTVIEKEWLLELAPQFFELRDVRR